MDINQIIRLLFRRSVYLVVVMIGFGLIGWQFATSKDPVYHASVDLLVSSEINSDNFVSIQGSIKLMDTYNVLFRNKLIVNQVIDKLKLPYDYDTLVKNITAKSVELSQVIRVTVTDPNPDIAISTVNSLVGVFKKESDGLFHLSNVSVLHLADRSVEQFPDRPNAIIYCLLGAFGGLIMAGSSFLLWELLSPFLNNKQETEEALGLSVIEIFDNDRLIGRRLLKKLYRPYRFKLEDRMQASSFRMWHRINAESIQTIVHANLNHTKGSSEMTYRIAEQLALHAKTLLLRIDKGRQKRNLPRAKPVSDIVVKGWKLMEVGHESQLTEYVISPFDVSAKPLLDKADLIKMLNKLKETYGIIVIETPPLNQWSGSQIVMQAAGRGSLIIRNRKITAQKAREWRERLEVLDVKLLGVLYLSD